MCVLSLMVRLADYRNGTIRASITFLQSGTGHSVASVRNAINNLIRLKLIETTTPVATPATDEVTDDKTQTGTVYLIINYNSWLGAPYGDGAEVTEPATVPTTTPATTNKESNKKAIKKTTHSSQSLDEFKSTNPWVPRVIEECWIKQGAKLPKKATTDKSTYLNLLHEIRKMKDVDGYDEETIRNVITIAAEEWYPKFIASPSSLRSLTRDGKENKTGETKFESILRRMKPAATQKSAVSAKGGIKFGVTQGSDQ